MENEENDKNELNASNENIGFGMERAKYSHQTHNRRIDFPNRKSAGGSSALSQISQAKQSLGQLQQSRPASIKLTHQGKIGRLSPSNSPNGELKIQNNVGLGVGFNNNG